MIFEVLNAKLIATRTKEKKLSNIYLIVLMIRERTIGNEHVYEVDVAKLSGTRINAEGRDFLKLV